MPVIEIYWDDLTEAAQHRLFDEFPEWVAGIQICLPIAEISTGEDEE